MLSLESSRQASAEARRGVAGDGGGEELTGRALRYRGRGRGLYAAVERRGGRRRRRDDDSFSDEFDDSEEETDRAELPKRGRVRLAEKSSPHEGYRIRVPDSSPVPWHAPLLLDLWPQ